MITNLKVGHNKGLTLHLFDIIDEELTSSFVVWFEPTKYEWKPVNPTIDQIEKKQIIASKIVQKVKDTISNHENCASTVWHDLIICSVILSFSVPIACYNPFSLNLLNSVSWKFALTLFIQVCG